MFAGINSFSRCIMKYFSYITSTVSQRGKKDVTAPIACIGAGTGLGECFLTPNPDGVYYSCFPSEGGHADFAPRSSMEVGLLDFLKTKFQQKHRVSVERVISGSGLVNVYEYLALTRPTDVDAAVQRLVDDAGDMKGAVIAGNQQNILCKETMRIFVTVSILKPIPFVVACVPSLFSYSLTCRTYPRLMVLRPGRRA